jgi:predicted acyl esterase
VKRPSESPDVTVVYPAEFAGPARPPAGAVISANQYVAMRDGIQLAVDIYSPPAEGRFPALLSLSPYSKDIQQQPPQWSHAIESGATAFYVANGYVHVIAQGRGAGRSQGRWGLFDEGERTDGYDLIEWIAEQPWCDGNVGTIGDSYWSWSQYHAAAQRPPHLRCICQCDAATDFYRDLIYQGGVYNAEFLDKWVPYHTRMMAWPGPVAGKEPPLNLPYEVTLRPYDGAWYRERSPVTYLDRIEVPVMSISPQGGAIHMRGQLAGFPKIRSPKKLLVVPPTGFWSHTRYLTNRALNAQMLRWFDHWLKGVDTGIMDEPQVAIFDAGTRDWHHAERYPIAETVWTELYVRSAEQTPADPARGRLAFTPPQSEAPDSYRLPDSLARSIDGDGALTYATDPLEVPLRVWGPVGFTLYASSSQTDTVWHVKLLDRAPDGAARPLSRGILRASFRAVDLARSLPAQPYHPFETTELLEPGTAYAFEIEMRPIFFTFAAGHRIELQISSEDIAYSNYMRQLDVQLLPWPVENTVYHTGERASHLLLPVIPQIRDTVAVSAPISEIAWPVVPGFWRADTTDWPLRATVKD